MDRYFISFVFNWADPDVDDYYSPPTIGPALQAVARSGLRRSAKARTGDLLLVWLTQRLSEVRLRRAAPNSGDPMRRYAQTSHSLTDDVDARAQLTLGIMRAVPWLDVASDLDVMVEAFLRSTCCATTVGPLGRAAVRRVVQNIDRPPGYLGLSLVDMGSPLIRQVFWSDLSERYLVGPGPAVRLIPDPFMSLDEQWTTPDGHFTARLEGVRAKGWASQRDLDRVPPMGEWPLSNEAIELQTLYRQLTTPTRREALAADLRDVASSLVSSINDEFVFFTAVPNADGLTIADVKLVEYVLNPDHPEGRHKARFFSKELGIEREDWRYLAGQLMEKLPFRGARRIRVTSHGLQYDVDLEIEGREGSVAMVRSAWIVQGALPPRLVTLVPAPRRL